MSSILYVYFLQTVLTNRIGLDFPITKHTHLTNKQLPLTSDIMQQQLASEPKQAVVF